MRILIVHNFYGSSSPSGENVVFELESKLLQKNGHTVSEFCRHSDEIRNRGLKGVIHGALTTPWNELSRQSFERAIQRYEPHIIHVHNVFPLISPAVFHAKRNQSAVVLTLHNYRIFCPAAIPTRNGMICTECIDRKTILPSLMHRCYRKSLFATIPLAISVALHNKINTWRNLVDAFIVFTEFQKEFVIKAGLPKEKVFVKPNYFPGTPALVPWSERDDSVVFAGRVSAEKGICDLIDAWEMWGAAAPRLKIVGDGPLADELKYRTKSSDRIIWCGARTLTETCEIISRSKLLLLPSRWFEGFPMVIREAFAFGTPIGVSDIGPLHSLVVPAGAGFSFFPSNSNDLFEKVKKHWDSNGELEERSRSSRLQFETIYNEDANYKNLMNIYENAIINRKRSVNGT